MKNPSNPDSVGVADDKRLRVRRPNDQGGGKRRLISLDMLEQKPNTGRSTRNIAMSQASPADFIMESERLDVATDEAIAACGGDLRDIVRALIVVNEFLETQISNGYMRGVRHGRFKNYTR